MSCKRHEYENDRKENPVVQTNRRRGGFSLVEIMIALVIVGLLATVVTINVRSYLLNAKRKKATQDIAALQGALDTYFAEVGR